jgi:cardiolipin synthase A/B
LKLLIQPGDGIEPLVKAIKKAKKIVQILIFRFDRTEIERALVEAVERGVFVHALIAFTNRGGEKRLRDLETEFLAKGITVARTSGDLIRYHGKMMIIDRKELFLLGFNFTHLDMERSRSFGLVTRNPKLVQEAVRLYAADTKRQQFTSKYAKLVVSPDNARKQLGAFIKGARHELLIYDPKVSDKIMLRRLRDRIQAGVKVRIIGRSPGGALKTHELGTRLHVRAIIRDRCDAFIGSQSLRRIELDSRREIGVIFRDREIVSELRHTFEEDWTRSERASAKPVRLPVGKAARKVASVVTKKLPMEPLAKRVEKAIRKNGSKLHPKDVRKTMRVAVKQSVQQAVEKAAREAVADVLDRAG